MKTRFLFFVFIMLNLILMTEARTAGYYGYSWGIQPRTTGKSNAVSAKAVANSTESSSTAAANTTTTSETSTSTTKTSATATTSTTAAVAKVLTEEEQLLDFDYIIKAGVIENNSCVKVGSKMTPSIDAWLAAVKEYHEADKLRDATLKKLVAAVREKIEIAKIDQKNAFDYSVEEVNLQILNIKGIITVEESDSAENLKDKNVLSANSLEKIRNRLLTKIEDIINKNLSSEKVSVEFDYNACVSSLENSNAIACKKNAKNEVTKLCDEVTKFNAKLKSSLLDPFKTQMDVLNTILNLEHNKTYDAFYNQVRTYIQDDNVSGKDKSWKEPLILCTKYMPESLQNDSVSCKNPSESSVVATAEEQSKEYSDLVSARTGIIDAYTDANINLAKAVNRSGFFNAIKTKIESIKVIDEANYNELLSNKEKLEKSGLAGITTES